jgi:hypothetical protein
VRLTRPVTRIARPPALLFPLLILGVMVVSACGGDDGGGVIEDNLIRPGITAMNQASELACNADEAALTMALEAYEIMNGDPASDQAALVEAGFLREPSMLHEVLDGQIRPIDPGCT